MLTHKENELLTHIMPNDPMGKLMRQHWTPVCLIEELGAPDGTPVLVEVLGSRMVAFRDTEGRVGLLDELCPHRLASLVLGRNEDFGIRCLYHGWKFDVEGNAVAMSSEPPESGMCNKLKHKSYKTVEWGGFLWAWLGNDEDAPEFQPPPFAPNKEVQVSILKIRIPANWAQIMEGQIDSAHSSSLHSSDMLPAKVDSAAADDKSWYRPSTDKSPRLKAARTEYGFQYAAIRRPISNSSTHDYIRITQYVAPYCALIPPNTSYNVSAVVVPIDNENSNFHFIAWGNPETTPNTQAWREFARAVPGVDVDSVTWATVGNMDNRFRQNRINMKDGDFTGISGIPNQDIAMWVSMGPIVNRTDDILGASDLAIVEFRRLMIEAAKKVAEAGPAIGTSQSICQASIASFQGVVPKNSDWRELWQANVIKN